MVSLTNNKVMKKIILIYYLLTIYALSPLTTLAEEITCEENVLRELTADERRFQGVHNLARLFEAYYDATGFYPGTKGWEDSKYESLIVRISDQDLPEDFRSLLPEQLTREKEKDKAHKIGFRKSSSLYASYFFCCSYDNNGKMAGKIWKYENNI